LEQIADEANVKRSLIRHYIGNREALVDEVIERITRDFLQQVREMGASVPKAKLLEAILSFLFLADATYTTSEQVMLQVLISAQDRYPQAKRSLQYLFDELVTLLANDLMQLFPGRDPSVYRMTAYSVLCLSLANESMMWIGLDAAYNTAARQHAEILIRTLQGVKQ
jgi:AcrR family transcriptional regulator